MALEEDILPSICFKCDRERNGQGIEGKAGTVEDSRQGGGPKEQN